ncbi:MAG: hypothetical protein AB7K24_06170 [Gemmataceae bacterium]
MIDASTLSLLQEIVRRESRSLMHYTSEAYPWTGAAAREVLAKLNKMIAAEQKAVERLARLLSRRRLPLPYIGAYPDFTGVNYVSLDHLLPLLIEHQKKGIEQLERDLTCLYEVEVREQVQGILDVKKEHLTQLTALKDSATAGTVGAGYA